MFAEYLLSYRLVNAEKDVYHLTKTKNIGLGGLMFESEQLLPIGIFYQFSVIVADTQIMSEGRVAWTNRLSPSLFHIGVQFTTISDSNRDFLTTHLIDEHYV
jgi:hypothetical protein